MTMFVSNLGVQLVLEKTAGLAGVVEVPPVATTTEILVGFSSFTA